MDENGVGTGESIGLGTAQGFVHAPARNQCLDTRDDAKSGILLRILAGGDLADELLDVGQRLAFRVQKAIRLRKLLILDADTRDAALLELAHQAAHVVEIAVTGVAVEQYGQIAGIGHELEHVHNLGPTRLVVVAHAELRRDGQSGSPYALEARLAHDARGQAVVRFHEKLEFRAVQHLAQLRAARLRVVRLRAALGALGINGSRCLANRGIHSTAPDRG